MVINYLLTGMILQVAFQTPFVRFGMTGPRKYTFQTPNLRRHDWNTRVDDGCGGVGI